MRLKRVSVGQLKNGMRFYSQFDPNAHLGGIGVKAGSAHDPPRKRGLAHLTEHVVAGGSAKHDDRTMDLQYYEKYMGGPEASANIRTDYVSTFYGHDSLLWRPHLTDCFDMLANLILHPQIRESRLLVEKAAVHNEYYLYGEDSLYERAYVRLNRVLYEKNPVRNRIDCELPEFERLGASDVRAFMRRYYVPRNMFIVLFGPTFADVKKTAERYFEDWGGLTAPILDYDHSDDVPRLTAIRSIEETVPGNGQTHVMLGFPTETTATGNGAALDILARIFAFRLRARLREENRDFGKGVYRVLVFSEQTHLHGMLRVWFSTVSPAFAEVAEALICEEARTLRESLILSDELDAIRKNLEWQYRDAFKNGPGTLSEMVIASASTGDEELKNLHSYIPRLHEVTRNSFRELAQKYLASFYARAVIRPEQSGTR